MGIILRDGKKKEKQQVWQNADYYWISLYLSFANIWKFTQQNFLKQCGWKNKGEAIGFSVVSSCFTFIKASQDNRGLIIDGWNPIPS